MIKPHTNQSGTVFQVYGKSRIEGRSVKTYVGSFPTRKLAEKADEEHRARQRMVADGELPENADAKRTLDQAITAWLKYLDGEDSGAHRSRVIYEHRLRNHVPAALKAQPLARINTAKLESLQVSLKKAGELGNASINGVFLTLSSLFSWCVDAPQRWIAVNPALKVKRLSERKKVEADNPDGFRWIDSDAGITKLISVCTPNIKDLIIVLIGTGMRIDEALHLEWSDVDFKQKLIHVRRGRQGETKSGKHRKIPANATVLPTFAAMKANARKGDVLVFPGMRDKDGVARVRSKPGVFHPFKAALKAAGLSTKLRIHDLRHTYASRFLQQGGDIFRLSRYLGHATVEITNRVYAHLAKDAFVDDHDRGTFELPTMKAGKVLAFSATP